MTSTDERRPREADLVRRVSRLEFAAGALVRCGVNPRTGSRGLSLPPIDVLAIDFDRRMRETRTIFECQVARGQKAESERLLWLAGFRLACGADEAVLVRDSGTGIGRHLADRLHLRIEDASGLERREREVAWMPLEFGWVGESEWSRLRLSISSTPTLSSSSPLAALEANVPLSEAHSILADLESAASWLSDVTPGGRGEVRYAAAICMEALVVAALRLGGSLARLSPRALATDLEARLIAPGRDPRQVLELIRIADAYADSLVRDAHDAYAATGVRRVDIPHPSIAEALRPERPWIERMIDLCERFQARPDLAKDLPQVVSLAAMDGAIGGRPYKAPAFDHLFTIEHRQMLAVVADVLRAMGFQMLDTALAEVLRLGFGRGPGLAPARREPYQQPDVAKNRYAQTSRTPNGTLEVVASNASRGWDVRGESGSRRSFKSKAEAISFARDAAKQGGGGDVIVHSRNGLVQARESIVDSSLLPLEGLEGPANAEK